MLVNDLLLVLGLKMMMMLMLLLLMMMLMMMKYLLLVLGLLILTPSTPGPPGEVGALIFSWQRICILDATKSNHLQMGGLSMLLSGNFDIQ